MLMREIQENRAFFYTEVQFLCSPCRNNSIISRTTHCSSGQNHDRSLGIASEVVYFRRISKELLLNTNSTQHHFFYNNYLIVELVSYNFILYDAVPDTAAIRVTGLCVRHRNLVFVSGS